MALWAATSVVASPQASPRKLRQNNSKPASAAGKQTFASSCSGCHGLDGRGGERAPNIAENPWTQRLSDAQIIHIIENGIPGSGMPAFRSLQSSDIKAIVVYLRTLQGTKQEVKLPGDPKRGETIFFGKGGCSGCHMVEGKGGFIASDLSGYGRTHSLEEARSAIANPANDRQARTITITTREGDTYVGRMRNEDNFSVQMQTLDGTFHFVMKSDVASMNYGEKPLMPLDYGSTLSREEMNDIISYLVNASNTNERGAPTKEKDREED